jgi:hypothetical protein
VDLAELTALQDGVIRRRQLLEFDVTPQEIRRKLRRRELVRVCAGVYVEHTGPLTATQRRWVAVLACWPAALSHRTVTDPGAEGPVHVAVAHHRRLIAPDGVVVHRLADFDKRVRWNASPPTVRFEHAVIDLAWTSATRSAASSSSSTAAPSTTLPPLEIATRPGTLTMR